MTLSDSPDIVHLWEAPFFEQPKKDEEQLPLAELEAAAQAKGYAVGKEEGLAQGRIESQQIVAAISALADQMAAPYQGLDATVTKELAEMAMHLAEQIVRRELTIDSSVVNNIVEQALDTLYKLEGEIVIFLNPVDATLLRNFSPEGLEGKTWKICEDESMSAGGCQVKTPSSFVDGSVERQIESLFSSLLASCEQGLES